MRFGREKLPNGLRSRFWELSAIRICKGPVRIQHCVEEYKKEEIGSLWRRKLMKVRLGMKR